MGVADGGRCDFVVCAEVVDVTERDEVVERLDVETEVRIGRSTVSVFRSSVFSWDWRGVVISFLDVEVEPRACGWVVVVVVVVVAVVGVPDPECAGVGYVSSPWG